MGVIFLIAYIFIIITIISNAMKVVKSFRGTNSMFENVNDMVKQRYDSAMQNNMFEENKTNKEKCDVNLDDFMKSNSNPIKEVKGKRSRI